jgi:N-acetylglucosamine-6-sulfatase
MRKAKAQTVPAQPNIIFILTEDMRYDDLAYVPETRRLLGDGGMSFENAFVSTALCAPSRATIMRGQYAHNTGVLSNSSIDSSSTDTGGWPAYRQNRNEADNVTTRLQAAGYRTGLFGKYLNGCGDNRTFIPRGWDRWFATQNNFFNYNVNDQGTTVHFGTSESDYQTDVLSRQVNAFIAESASSPQPADRPVLAPERPKNMRRKRPSPQGHLQGGRRRTVACGACAGLVTGFEAENVSRRA